MNKKFLLSFVLVVLLSSYSISQAALLGPATDYNVFVFGDMNVANSDSKGRVAAGGNINMSNYSVGGEASSAVYSMVSGGDVNFGPGTVSNGGIFAQDDLALTNYTVYGDVTANGAISYFNGGTIYGTATPYAGASNPIDFAGAEAYLTSVSDALSSMTVNGTTDVVYYSRPQITFTGSSDVNIFSLDADDLYDASVITINVGDNIAVINVSSADVGGQFDRFYNLNIIGDYQQANILWNFFESTELTLTTTVQGSILAPNADVTFNNGNLWGTLVAESMTGGGEFHFPPFDHDIPVEPVPEPASMLLLGTGLVGLAGLKRKKKM